MAQNHDYKFVGLLSIAGLVSGLITIGLLATPWSYGFLLGSSVFGASMAGTFAICGMLDELWSAIWLISMSIAGYFLAIYAAFTVQLSLPPAFLSQTERWSMGQAGSASPLALFAGGMVGGIVALTGVLFLARRAIGMRTVFMKTISWSASAGVLAVIGWALSRFVGVALWNVLHALRLTAATSSPKDELHGLGEARLLYSVHLVWQIGMAFATGVVLRPYRSKLSRGLKLL